VNGVWQALLFLACRMMILVLLQRISGFLNGMHYINPCFTYFYLLTVAADGAIPTVCLTCQFFVLSYARHP